MPLSCGFENGLGTGTASAWKMESSVTVLTALIVHVSMVLMGIVLYLFYYNEKILQRKSGAPQGQWGHFCDAHFTTTTTQTSTKTNKT